MKTERIAWECPACGYRHRWDWERGEASPGAVTMCCDQCGHEHRTDFVQVGRYVWTAVWHDDEVKHDR